MPMPKSVTKIDKNGVKFISDVDRAQYTLTELSRAALKDIAKLTRKIAKDNVPFLSGTLKSNIATWVKKDKATGQLELQLGVYDAKLAKKRGKKPAIHAHFLEFGTKKMAKQPFLTPAVLDNIDEIRRIEGKYLSAIENENEAMMIIDESEEESSD
jgi:HK97 gp10 family phage protein